MSCKLDVRVAIRDFERRGCRDLAALNVQWTYAFKMCLFVYAGCFLLGAWQVQLHVLAQLLSTGLSSSFKSKRWHRLEHLQLLIQV